MKIAVVGCGALGSYYGACLARAGQETHFLLRSDLAAVRERGVRILAGAGEWTAHPHCAGEPDQIGPSELVLIGLKTTANHTLARVLPPLLGPGTAVLTLQNGWGNEVLLAQLMPATQVLGGLAYVSLNRVAPGVIRCQDAGSVVLGEWAGAATERTQRLVDLFNAAGIVTTATDRLGQQRWKKLVWNVAFNGLTTLGANGIENVLAGRFDQTPHHDPVLTADRLLEEPRWRRLTAELMLEVIRTATALGHELPESLAEEELVRTRIMGAYKPSTAVDFELGRLMEIESIFADPHRRAQAAGVATPRWDALLRQLSKRLTAPRAFQP